MFKMRAEGPLSDALLANRDPFYTEDRPLIPLSSVIPMLPVRRIDINTGPRILAPLEVA